MKNEYIDFIKALQQLYLEQRDMGNILLSIDEDISWIGTGKQEICKNFSAAAKALLREKREYDGGFTITDSWYETRMIKEDVHIVYGEFSATARDSSAGMADLHQRISAVCVKTQNGIKLVHLHMSIPDNDQEIGEYFVKTKTRDNHQALYLQYAQTAQSFRDKSLELEILTANIPGGVHRCSNDTELSILSMSRSFLDMFGYTKQEISELYHNQFIYMIYEDDRVAFIQAAKEQLSHGCMMEFEHRVRRKNEDLMWVLLRGKLVTGADGTESFYCMTMDITKRKTEDEKLRFVLERRRALMDSSPL